MMALAKVPNLRKDPQYLRARMDWERARREGRSWGHRLLVLVARRNDLCVTRVGVAAGKRVGSAVARNRAKRLMREAVRAHYHSIALGWDVIVIARATITQVKMQDVAAALEWLLRQAGLITQSGERLVS